MEKKICSLCKKEKPINEFGRKRNTYQARCKECFNFYTRAHYQNNKDYYIEKADRHNNEYRLRNLQYIVDYLKLHPCIDCNETDTIVLEFDHRDDKLCNVSSLIEANLEKLKLEISKCDVRCANCHRKKTAIQLGWYKGIIL